MEKTSVVLGASGLIGRLLILDLLQKSNKVIAILRNDEVLPNDVEQGFEECLSLFKTIENFLDVCKDKHDAIKITPLNTDGWMFDDYTRKKAKEIWSNNETKTNE